MTTAIATTNNNLKTLLMRALPSIRGVAPKHLSPERVVRIACLAASRDSKLLACSPESILGAVMQSSQLGLEIGGVSGHAYLVPFRNRKTSKWEAQFIPGYRGLLQLVWRAARIDIDAHVVRANDRFSFRYGSDPAIEHTPSLDDPGDVVAAYATARLDDGRIKFDVMSRADIDRIRSRSQSGGSDYSPWSTDWDEMAKKTVAKRLIKWLPTSSNELAKALEIDNRADQGQVTAYGDVIDVPEIDEPDDAPEPEQVAQIKERGRKKAQPPEDAPPVHETIEPCEECGYPEKTASPCFACAPSAK